MAVQYCFKLPDEPGSLAKVAEAMANESINIDGLTGISANGQGFIKMVVDNSEQAEEVLESAGFDFEKEEVLLVKLVNKPGQIAMFSRALADEGINFDTFYITMSGKQVVRTNNLKRTKEIAEELEVL